MWLSCALTCCKAGLSSNLGSATPLEVPPTEPCSCEDTVWRHGPQRMLWMNYCMNVCNVKIKINIPKEWHTATKPLSRYRWMTKWRYVWPRKRNLRGGRLESWADELSGFESLKKWTTHLWWHRPVWSCGWTDPPPPGSRIQRSKKHRIQDPGSRIRIGNTGGPTSGGVVQSDHELDDLPVLA